MAKKNWMKNAVKKPGAFSAQAKKAGMSVSKFANKVTKAGSKSSGLTKKRATLAKTFAKFRKKK
jgi:hypothetical protein